MRVAYASEATGRWPISPTAGSFRLLHVYRWAESRTGRPVLLVWEGRRRPPGWRQSLNHDEFSALRPTAGWCILGGNAAEDRATLESDPSAAAGPYGKGRLFVRGAGLFPLPVASMRQTPGFGAEPQLCRGKDRSQRNSSMHDIDLSQRVLGLRRAWFVERVEHRHRMREGADHVWLYADENIPGRNHGEICLNVTLKRS